MNVDSLLLRAADTLEHTSRRLRRRGMRASIVRKVTLADLEHEGWTSVSPVFVLSTGRCGTQLLTELLEAAGGVSVAHAPRPELVRVSKRAYEEVHERPDIFAEVIKTAREEALTDAARLGHTYVETNNRVTFFAPVIAQVFPRSRFVHLVRHPADIVRSGVRRGWYGGKHAHDLGRIDPTGGAAAEEWGELDPVGRIAWMWNETNAFIDRFREQLDDPTRVTLVRAEDLFAKVATARELLAWCGAGSMPDERIGAMLSRPVNAQRGGDFPAWPHWSDEHRRLLQRYAPLARTYGYDDVD